MTRQTFGFVRSRPSHKKQERGEVGHPLFCGGVRTRKSNRGSPFGSDCWRNPRSGQAFDFRYRVIALRSRRPKLAALGKARRGGRVLSGLWDRGELGDKTLRRCEDDLVHGYGKGGGGRGCDGRIAGCRDRECIRATSGAGVSAATAATTTAAAGV